MTISPATTVSRADLTVCSYGCGRCFTPRSGGGSMTDSDPFLIVVYGRVLAGQHELAQVSFDAAVLNRYRSQPAYSLIRTNTVGRLKREGGWSLDFGISADEAQVHACQGDLAALPEEDRRHWAAHAALPGASRNFLRMRLHPGSCFDDGELRAWE